MLIEVNFQTLEKRKFCKGNVKNIKAIHKIKSLFYDALFTCIFKISF